MQTIVVDCISVVDPQLASIVRNNAQLIVACPADSQHTCPTHGEMIASGKTTPLAVRVAVVDDLNTASHVRPATVKVLTAATLPKVEHLLSEDLARASSARTDNLPSVARIWTLVPEQHPSMASTLKHFKPHSVSPRAKMLDGLTIAPTVQAIVVDCIPIVYPQLTSIIRDNAETVITSFANSQGAHPAHSKMVTSGEALPFAVRVSIIHDCNSARHVWSATLQVLASVTLTKVVHLFPESRPAAVS
jgi:hypothetical protein